MNKIYSLVAVAIIAAAGFWFWSMQQPQPAPAPAGTGQMNNGADASVNAELDTIPMDDPDFSSVDSDLNSL
jgi:hypothetical protein